MNADEIRAKQFPSFDAAGEAAFWLREIAAQIAELNAKLTEAANLGKSDVNV